MALGRPPALLAVAHGSADPRAAAANEALIRRAAGRLPEVRLRLAYLDHVPPSVPDALASLARDGVEEAVVLPLLLTVGYHSRTDIPVLLRDVPLPVRYGRVLGPHPRLLEAVGERLAEARVRPDAPVVLVAAGSSDPDAAHDIEATAKALGRQRGTQVFPAYASAITPTVPEALDVAGPDAAVALYFLAPGRLPDRVARQAAGRRVSPTLTDHPGVVAALLERYREAQRR